MPQIQQLPAHIADLIAAGEVVERPASVCKELLENALDAGASAVSVELEKGGMTYLRVTDNGCGIAPEQLPTAFLRHATSKLHRAEDLAAIGTLGFRGEALAAISAVSRVDIFSRQRETDSGASLHLEGGVPGDVKAAGCPEGTTICVRELFYNTPARMKFMKKDSAEGAAATSVVTQLALSHPDVSFKLLRDGQEVLHTPGDGQLLSAVYAALGRDFAQKSAARGRRRRRRPRLRLRHQPRRRSRHTGTAAVLRQRAAGQEPAAHRRRGGGLPQPAAEGQIPRLRAAYHPAGGHGGRERPPGQDRGEVRRTRRLCSTRCTTPSGTCWTTRASPNRRKSPSTRP